MTSTDPQDWFEEGEAMTDDLRALAEGPLWVASDKVHYGVACGIWQEGAVQVPGNWIAYGVSPANAALIVAMRNALPALLDKADRLEAILDPLQDLEGNLRHDLRGEALRSLERVYEILAARP